MEIGFDIEKYLVHSKKVDYFRVADHPTVCWDQETMHAPRRRCIILRKQSSDEFLLREGS